MSTRINGKTDATLNAEEIRYSPQDGWSGNWSQQGPKESIKALLNPLAAQGFTLRYSCDQSPVATVQYSTTGIVEPGGVETPTLVWEYFANIAEIDILEADLGGTLGRVNGNAISEDDKRLIRQAIQSPSESSPAISGADAITLYQLMLGGVRSFRVNVPTLRVSKLVSGSYPVKASLTNVGRIITTATLEVQEAIPATLLFNLPVSSTVSKGGISFAHTWYKHFPNVQQVGGNRWNVSQGWEFGLFPINLYGTAL